MRVSRRQDDDCFIADPCGIKIFLNGELQRHVVFADDEAGVVIVHVHGVDRFIEETHRGLVRIELPSDAIKS